MLINGKLKLSSKRGFAINSVVLLILVVLPISLVAYKMVSQVSKATTASSQKRIAAEHANNLVMDYFRQFTNSHYSFFFGTSGGDKLLDRSEFALSKGFTDFQVEENEEARTIYVQGEGKFGLNASSPTATNYVSALILFQSDLARFGTNVEDFGISWSNATYTGPVKFNNLNLTGSNITFAGGPVIIKNNLNATQNFTVDGDMYLGGNQTGSGVDTVNGTKYNYAPNYERPSLDFNYYDTYSTWESTEPITIWFHPDGTYQTTTSLNNYITNYNHPWNPSLNIVWSASATVPASGGLFFGKNVNLGVGGTVGERVTVVASGPSGATNKGCIYPISDLWYVGQSSAASADSSLALLAYNTIIYRKPQNNQTLSTRGIHFCEVYGSFYLFPGATNRAFYFYGTRANGVYAYAYNQFNIQYDPNLKKFPPPGLPERPYLVNYQLRRAL